MNLDVTVQRLEQDVRAIRRQLGGAFLRVGNAGGARPQEAGFTIDEVPELPAIPTDGSRIVRRNKSGTDTARGNQHWIARAGDTKWSAMEMSTTLAGNPGD